MRFKRKNRLTTIITVSLAILILAVGSVGLYTYVSLDKVVNQLRYESAPNFNLIILKDIMVSISGIENDMESYLLTENETHLNRYNQRISDANIFLDSLQTMNQNDPGFIRYTDSLESLIKQKVEILGTLEELVSYNLSGSINELAEKLDKMPIELNSQPMPALTTPMQKPDIANTIPSDTATLNEEDNDGNSEKKGLGKWISSLFSKSKKEEVIADEKPFDTVDQNRLTNANRFQSDSNFIAQKTQEYRKKLQLELIQLRNESKVITEDIRQRQLELAQNQQVIQSRIIDLLTYLEEREVDKIKLRNYNAQIIADETNDQVLVFSLLMIMLLLGTSFVIYSYVEKNKAYQKVLTQATEDANNLAKAKEQFLANMSHEIRTPMNAIAGFTQQLLKSDLSTSQHEQLDIVHRSSGHLLHILNDVLDFSKLQAHKLTLENQPYDLPQLMDDSVKLMQHKADEKNIRINYYPSKIPHFIKGDPYRFKQILINLVSNSIKFTDTGSVDIYLSAINRFKVNELELIVEDSGIGIPDDQQSRIMMEFEQAGSASDHKGTGLGLSITKKLVALHNGKMTLNSEIGRGTKITIKLPFIESEEPAETKIESNPQINLDGIYLLIADDEPFNIKLLETILKPSGAKWVTCRDGQEAIEQLQLNKFDMALLDLKMPSLSGLEVASKVREEIGPNKDIPLIALTATVVKEDLDQCIKHGFNNFLKKPFDENELLTLIDSGIQVSTKKTAPKKSVTSPPYDLKGLHDLGDESFVIEMLETFLASSQPGVRNIKTYYEHKNWVELADEAHKIVAPARYIGAIGVVEHLKSLELEARKDLPKITSMEIKAAVKALDQLNTELNIYLDKVQV